MIIKRKLGPKGQLSLPKVVRKLLGVKPGEEIYIEIKNEEVKIKAATDVNIYLKTFYDVPQKLKVKIDIEKQLEDEYE